jgi:hypothetical protein
LKDALEPVPVTLMDYDQ